MSNLAIIFAVVLFASAANAAFIPDYKEAVHPNGTDEIDKVISDFNDVIEDTEETTLEVSEVLFDTQIKYITNVADKTKIIRQEAEDRIREFAEQAEGVNIKECLKLSEGLDEVAADTILLTSQCIYDTMLPAGEYTTGIEMVCTDVLSNLTATREVAQECGDDFDCIITATASAIQVSLEGTSDLNIRLFDFKYWSEHFEESVSVDCASDNQTEDLEEEASTVINNVHNCIIEKINESQARSPKIL